MQSFNDSIVSGWSHFGSLLSGSVLHCLWMEHCFWLSFVPLVFCVDHSRSWTQRPGCGSDMI